MTDLALIASDPNQLDPLGGDAGEFVVLACERAKTWLTQAIEHGDIDQLVELKSQADAIRVYTRQKELGKDAELAAQEIVRRAERGLAVAVRSGQEAGEFLTKGQRAKDHPDKRMSADVFGGDQEAFESRVMASVPDDQFEEILDEAKGEGNLSRANVVRKVKGVEKMTPEARRGMIRSLASSSLTSEQIAAKVGVSAVHVRKLARDMGVEIHADKVMGKTRKFDSDRIVSGIVERVEFDMRSETAQLIDYASLDRSQLDHWVSSLTATISSLTTLRNNLRKELTRE